MGRLSERFADLHSRGEVALIPFVMAGDPDLATTELLVLALAQAGADAVEIGVPFSDPIAEGPTLQRATERALRAGTSLSRVLALVRGLRQRVELPLILMGYANNFLNEKAEPFAAAAAQAGVDGVIVVDLPPEEGREFFEALRAAGIDSILLAAPTTTPERLRTIARETRGFLYYVSLTGVTGAREKMAQDLEVGVRRAREVSSLPVCVGFGISTPEHAAAIAHFADGVVVGSALVERIAAAPSPEAAVDAAARFVRKLKQALS